MTLNGGDRCRVSGPSQEDLVIEAARRVSRSYEHRYDLERGALFGIAWTGAHGAAKRWRPSAEGRFSAYVSQGAAFAVRAALRDGEHDGGRRRHDGSRVRPERLHAELGPGAASDDEDDDGLDPGFTAPEADPDARLDAAALRSWLADHLDARTALVVLQVDGEGRLLKDVAADLGISPARAGQLRARAHRAARSNGPGAPSTRRPADGCAACGNGADRTPEGE